MPHTAAKHQILRKYLGAWFPKLAWTGRVIFIDGFAGPGEYSDGEPGSPLIALDVASNHKGNLSRCELVFIFVEKDGARFAHLSELLEATAVPDYMRWHAVRGEFSEHIARVLDSIEERGQNLAPSFMMVDPFGFSVCPSICSPDMPTTQGANSWFRSCTTPSFGGETTHSTLLLSTHYSAVPTGAKPMIYRTAMKGSGSFWSSIYNNFDPRECSTRERSKWWTRETGPSIS